MRVHHIVMFQFKADANPEAVNDGLSLTEKEVQICTRMLALKDACLHPATTKPYIKSSMGGRDNSIEGLQHGITHVFVVEFESVADRNYYVKEDAAHRDFVKTFVTAPGSIVEKAAVVDFSPGVFQLLT